MFDGSDESEDNQSYDSDWSESFWKDDEEDKKLPSVELPESSRNLLNTLSNSGNPFGSDVSFDSNSPAELTDVSHNNDTSSERMSNNSGSFESMHIMGEGGDDFDFSEGEFSDDGFLQYPNPACTEKLDDVARGHSQSEQSSSNSTDGQHGSEESRGSSQAGGGNHSYRGVSTNEQSDAFIFFNGPPFDTPDMFEMDFQPPTLVDSEIPGGYATIIRAFSVWTELEQLDRPPPPASKEVVDNLGTMEVTEKSYQCPVCLGICEIGEILKQLPCSHGFHSECILPWLEKTNTCPLCRCEMPTDNEDYELFRSIESGRQMRA